MDFVGIWYLQRNPRLASLGSRILVALNAAGSVGWSSNLCQVWEVLAAQTLEELAGSVVLMLPIFQALGAEELLVVVAGPASGCYD